jgi:hypothetical protein
LRARGFRSTDISVLFPQNVGSKEFGHEKGTKLVEGAVAGGGTGAVIGGALGWLAGIGMLAIPGVGPFIAAGPIVAVLAGMGGRPLAPSARDAHDHGLGHRARFYSATVLPITACGPEPGPLDDRGLSAKVPSEEL